MDKLIYGRIRALSGDLATIEHIQKKLREDINFLIKYTKQKVNEETPKEDKENSWKILKK